MNIQKGDLLNLQSALVWSGGDFFPEEQRGFYEVIGFCKTKSFEESYKNGNNRFHSCDSFHKIILLKSIIEEENCYSYSAAKPYLYEYFSDEGAKLEIKFDKFAHGSTLEDLKRHLIEDFIII